MEKNVIKYTPVVFTNLPKQDYAKAKAIVTQLEIGQYTEVYINDFNDFVHYVDLLCENGNTMIIKLSSLSSHKVNILNTGVKNKKLEKSLIIIRNSIHGDDKKKEIEKKNFILENL